MANLNTHVKQLTKHDNLIRLYYLQRLVKRLKKEKQSKYKIDHVKQIIKEVQKELKQNDYKQ